MTRETFNNGQISLHLSECGEMLSEMPADSIDLVFTSPPYAQQRKDTYGGVHADRYAEWFLPISAELLRVLKPTGTFILNIREHVTDGQINTYVLKLILALAEQGWRWTEEFIWHKKNAFPGKWATRFRNAWERVLQFNKSADFYMNQDAVMIPRKEATAARYSKLSANDYEYRASENQSGFARRQANFAGREMVYPDNVLYIAVESRNKNHPAVFPEALPEWFIRLFTPEGATVLDPFLGSGTTAIACHRHGRRFIGCEIDPKYFHVACQRVAGHCEQRLIFS